MESVNRDEDVSESVNFQQISVEVIKPQSSDS
jgi:hypothetical protein